MFACVDSMEEFSDSQQDAIQELHDRYLSLRIGDGLTEHGQARRIVKSFA